MENSIENINQGRPVYFSYARNSNRKPEWEHISDCVDTLLNTLTDNHLEYRVDVKDIGMGDKISKFEEEIGWNSEVVVIIFSDKYFRSMHCMYEFVQIKKALEQYPEKRLMCIKSGDFNLADFSYIRELERYWSNQKVDYEDIEYHRLRKHSGTEIAACENGFYLDDIRELYSFFSAINYSNAANINYDSFVGDIVRYYKTTPKPKLTPRPPKYTPKPQAQTVKPQAQTVNTQAQPVNTQTYNTDPRPYNANPQSTPQFAQNNGQRAVSTSQPADKNSSKVPIAIAAVLVVALVIYLMSGKTTTTEQPVTTTAEQPAATPNTDINGNVPTVVAIADNNTTNTANSSNTTNTSNTTNRTNTTNTSNTGGSKMSDKQEKPTSNSQTTTGSWPYGQWTGGTKNGKPHGSNVTVIYSTECLYNSKDPLKRKAKPGQKVVGMYENGMLIIGDIYDASGNLIEKDFEPKM